MLILYNELINEILSKLDSHELLSYLTINKRIYSLLQQYYALKILKQRKLNAYWNSFNYDLSKPSVHNNEINNLNDYYYVADTFFDRIDEHIVDNKMHIIFEYKKNMALSSFKIANLDKLQSKISQIALKIGDETIEIIHTFDDYTILDVYRYIFKINDNTVIPFGSLTNNYIPLLKHDVLSIVIDFYNIVRDEIISLEIESKKIFLMRDVSTISFDRFTLFNYSDSICYINEHQYKINVHEEFIVKYLVVKYELLPSLLEINTTNDIDNKTGINMDTVHKMNNYYIISLQNHYSNNKYLDIVNIIEHFDNVNKSFNVIHTPIYIHKLQLEIL